MKLVSIVPGSQDGVMSYRTRCLSTPPVPNSFAIHSPSLPPICPLLRPNGGGKSFHTFQQFLSFVFKRKKASYFAEIALPISSISMLFSFCYQNLLKRVAVPLIFAFVLNTSVRGLFHV